MKNKFNIKGQSLYEVVIAFFMMSVIIVGVVILATNSITNSSFSKNKTLASRYAQEATEWLRGQRDAGMDEFIAKIIPPVETYTYCLDTLSWSNTGTCSNSEFITGSTIFKREVVLRKIIYSGKNIIEVDISVIWDDSKGEHEVRSVTNFSDIREK